jgi:predicted enzyme related to lactoylglutathione lyase
MGERTSYEPGTFCWVDVATSDPEGAKAFYGALFGWSMQDVPGGQGTTYTRASLGGDHAAGIYGGAPPRWTSYVCVEDADATVARARELGGKVEADPADVGGGRRTEIADPAGAVVAIWEPGDQIGAGRVNEPNTLCWNELALPDVAAVQGFYEALFGWQFQPVPTPEGAPEIVGIANRTGWRNGNLRGTTDQPPAWTPYFGAESCEDAARRATELGGRLLFGPLEVPTGHLAIAADPQGAVFGLVDGEMDP